jgi:hypothetical protein
MRFYPASYQTFHSSAWIFHRITSDFSFFGMGFSIDNIKLFIFHSSAWIVSLHHTLALVFPAYISDLSFFGMIFFLRHIKPFLLSYEIFLLIRLDCSIFGKRIFPASYLTFYSSDKFFFVSYLTFTVFFGMNFSLHHLTLVILWHEIFPAS